MSPDSLDFSFSQDLAGIDRTALLQEAAQRLDAMGAHLGGMPVKL